MAAHAVNTKDVFSRPLEPRSEGVLMRTNPEGYGFIRPDRGPDHFVHISDFPNREAWVPGQRVSFKPSPQVNARKAPRAQDITLIQAPEA